VRIEISPAPSKPSGCARRVFRTPDRTLGLDPQRQARRDAPRNLRARDRLRLGCVLGLVYGTSAEQMRKVLADIEQTLRRHPPISSGGRQCPLHRACRLVAQRRSRLLVRYAQLRRVTLIRQELLLTFMTSSKKPARASRTRRTPSSSPTAANSRRERPRLSRPGSSTPNDSGRESRASRSQLQPRHPTLLNGAVGSVRKLGAVKAGQQLARLGLQHTERAQRGER